MPKWYSGLMQPTSARGVPQTLDFWEAVPIASPLEDPSEASRIERTWTPVRVPWHWQLEDAFAAYEGFVLYRCRFAHGRPPIGTMVSLRFGGVYYAARVWLNGVYLGAHEGYFSAFEFDVTDIMVTDGDNELLVEVFSPEETEENDRKTIGGVWAMWDGMPPHINPGGIFKEVSLVLDREVRIRSLAASADHTGRVVAHVDLYCRQGSRVRLVGRVSPLGFEAPDVEFGREVQLEEGENRIDMGFHVPDARIWSTWDRGEQPLYELVMSCAGVEERTRFGACTVELRGWKIYLNGERIFLRGINYLPSDAYPARATNERLRVDASLVREAGMNAVRVHAHVADSGFYEACDELGLLVLQDFPLQWTHRRSVLGPAVAQAREMARILRGYPCVGIYLAHDEPFFVAPPEKWSPLGLLRTAAEVLSPRWVLWQRRVLDPARLERPRAELPPSGPTHGPLRSLERRPGGLLARDSALPGRGLETRHGAIPAAQVRADGGDLRLYAKRSRTCGYLVRPRLATPAEAGLRYAPYGHEPRSDLRRVPEGALRGRRNDLPATLHHQRSRTGAGSGALEVGGARRRIQHCPWRRRDEHTEGHCRKNPGSGSHTPRFRTRHTQARTLERKPDLQRVQI